MAANQKFFMAGTEGTGAYLVFVATAAGRIGVRDLGASSARIRVEPVPGGEAAIAAVLTRSLGWKQPGDNGQSRFSRVVGGDAAIRDAVGLALRALRVGDDAEWNPEAPAWARLVAAPKAVAPAPIVVKPAAVVVAGSDPQALRAEASLLRQEAAELRAQAAKAVERSAELEARAVACDQRAAEIEKAVAALEAARSRVRHLGVPEAKPATGLAAGLAKLPKATLLGVAKGLGLVVAPKATKAEIAALIAGAS